METCEVCGFAWDEIKADEVPVRLREAADGFMAVLADAKAEQLGTRPEAEVWSALEYSCHVRDVLLNMRDRIVVALVEDAPEPQASYTAKRIEKGMYARDLPSAVAAGIDLGTDLFTRTFTVLGEADLARPVYHRYPVRAERTVLWLAAQTLHEAEHHLADTRAQL